MVVLEEEFKQRAFDGKWQRWVKTMDTENMYTYTNEYGSSITLIPDKWIVTDVYDYIINMEGY